MAVFLIRRWPLASVLTLALGQLTFASLTKPWLPTCYLAQPLARLGRVLSQLRQAQRLHPSWLASQYGSRLGYLQTHLSADDWHYLQALLVDLA